MKYYVRRVGQAFLVLIVAITLAFVLFRLLPGGPLETMRHRLIVQARQSGVTVDREYISRILEASTGINPNKPLPIAYYEYARNIVLYQDFGRSIWVDKPVFSYLFKKLPWSIFLSVYGLAVGRTLGLLLGAVMAHREGSRLDNGLTLFTIFNRSVPYYVVAIVLLIVFGHLLGWFPTGGRTNPENYVRAGMNLPFMFDIVRHATLPILSMIVAGFGGALAFRGNCVRELGKSYIRVARLRGINSSRIAIRYVGRNSFLPVYTNLMMGIAGIFGTSIILETIFAYPGLGYATYNALIHRDYPLLMGTFIFYTTLTVLGILVADLTYGIIDPRVKGGGEREAY